MAGLNAYCAIIHKAFTTALGDRTGHWRWGLMVNGRALNSVVPRVLEWVAARVSPFREPRFPCIVRCQERRRCLAERHTSA